MAFVPNFTVSQTPATPSNILITDTSTGFDASITQKRVYIENSQGGYVVPSGNTGNYTLWLTGQTITLNILSEDQALNVKVEWCDQFGNVLYQKSANYCFSQYNQQYFYYLIQAQSQTYNIIQDNRYWQNMATYWVNIVGAIKAVELGNDIFGSQVCLNRATYMQNNALNFF
jgi:hypothetical protein